MSVTYKVLSCSNPAGAEGTDYACDRETKTGFRACPAFKKYVREYAQYKRVPSDLMA